MGNDEQELLDLRESNFDAAESSDFEAMSAVYTPKVARRRDLPGGGYAGLTGGGTISELDRETAEYCGDLRRRDE